MESVCCVLCCTTVEKPEYNLTHSLTLHSKTPLLHLLEKCVKKSVFFPNNILCRMCFLLLNEVDSINLRLSSIESQLIAYVDKFYTNIKSTEEFLSESFVACKKEAHNFPEEINIQELDTITDVPQAKTGPSLKSHLTVHKNKEPPFICEICGQVYKQQQALAVHVGMHNGINPFTCVHCNKSFTQKVALARHMPIHTGELPFQCDYCGKRFKHHTSFNIHQLSHSKKKSHRCEICGFSLATASHLKRHMRVHTNEKKFECDNCGKKFAERYNLVAHEKLHTQAPKKKKQIKNSEKT